jgi:hypothetical protein
MFLRWCKRHHLPELLDGKITPARMRVFFYWETHKFYGVPAREAKTFKGRLP